MPSLDGTRQEYRLMGGLLAAGGAALAYWAWSAARNGVYEMAPAVLGPTLLALGLGALVHTTRIAVAGINTVTRVYGIAGGLATLLLLLVYGFFERPGENRWLWLMESAVPFAMPIYWMMPSKWLGGAPHDPLAPAIAAAERERAARARPVHSGRSPSSTGAPSRKPATSSTATRRDKP